MLHKTKTAILISGRGSNMMSLLNAAAKDPNFPAEFVLVVSNDPSAKGLTYAKLQGIQTACIDHKTFNSREAFENALHTVLVNHDIQFICLAGFMRILTAGFIDQWYGRMLNIHPALLPSYPGLHTHKRALYDGVKIHGCTVHFVTAEVDRGAIVAQAAVPVLDHETPESLAARVLEQEHKIYPMALKSILSNYKTTIDPNWVLTVPNEVEI